MVYYLVYMTHILQVKFDRYSWSNFRTSFTCNTLHAKHGISRLEALALMNSIYLVFETNRATSKQLKGKNIPKLN